jgi:hypothetical protein
MTLRYALRRFLPTAWLWVAGVAVLPAAGCKSSENPPPPAPSTVSVSTAGPVEEFLRARGLQGQVALVQFGMVGCELSERGLGRMAALAKAEGVPAFLRVEGGPQSKAAEDYFAAKASGVPVYYDAQGAAGRMFDATVIPSYVLADKFGRIRYRGPWPDEAKLAAWAAALGAETADAGPQAPLFAAPLPDTAKLLAETRLADLGGAVLSLRDRMGLSGLMMVFVDTQCPFSVMAIGEMKSVAAVMATHQVPCVLVNIGESREEVDLYYAARPMGMPVLYDPGKDAQTSWAITSVPTVVLVNAEGAVLYRGKAVWADMGAAAEQGLGLPAGHLKFAVQGTEYG